MTGKGKFFVFLLVGGFVGQAVLRNKAEEDVKRMRDGLDRAQRTVSLVRCVGDGVDSAKLLAQAFGGAGIPLSEDAVRAISSALRIDLPKFRAYLAWGPQGAFHDQPEFEGAPLLLLTKGDTRLPLGDVDGLTFLQRTWTILGVLFIDQAMHVSFVGPGQWSPANANAQFPLKILLFAYERDRAMTALVKLVKSDGAVWQQMLSKLGIKSEFERINEMNDGEEDDDESAEARVQVVDHSGDRPRSFLMSRNEALAEGYREISPGSFLRGLDSGLLLRPETRNGRVVFVPAR